MKNQSKIMLILAIYVPAVLVATVSIITFGGVQPAQAASGKNFNPGRIIDDSVFYKSNSMSASNIQSFLNSKVPTCDTWGAQNSEMNNSGVPDYNSNGSIQRWEWGKKKYNQTKFTCLKNYSQSTPYTGAASGLCEAISSGTKSAATIIADVSKACGLNPQVLVVLLQKEQSLVSDTWPLNIQYQSATGFDCPDSAPCDPQYAGFFYQVYNAAKQFKIYKAYPGDYNYIKQRYNNIYWHPDLSRCGSSQVFIQNQATAALYIYTPYRPNTAALNNLYGTGDSCSSYGNRNFWRMFTDWFGSTTPSTITYSFLDAINPPSQLYYGQTATVQLRLVNTSSETWLSDSNISPGQRPFRLMMRGYVNNVFADTSDPAWLGTRNQIRMVEPSVAPGQTATFRFRVKAPDYSISYSEMNMVLVQDGIQVFSDLGLQFRLKSVPDYSYALTSIDYPRGLLPGDSYIVNFRLKNTGAKIWYSDSSLTPENPRPIRLASYGYKDVPYAYPDSDPAWLGTRNQIRMVEPSVAPGQTATFRAIFTSPYRSISNYSPNFRLVLDGVKFIAGPTIPMAITTPSINLSHSLVSITPPPTNMAPGQESTAVVKIKNTGNTIWRNYDRRVSSNIKIDTLRDMRIITNRPAYATSQLAPPNNLSWLNTSNQLRMVEPIVGPGKTATFNIPVRAPLSTGKYTQYFRLCLDGIAVTSDIGISFSINVTP